MSKEKPSQIIAKHFVDKFKLKMTGKMFMIQIGHVNTLLGAGFTQEEITDAIDYLYLNPPRNGFTSLGYLQYVMNDILPKIKVRKMNEVQKVFVEQNADMSDNLDKFKVNSSKPVIKGMGKF